MVVINQSRRLPAEENIMHANANSPTRGPQRHPKTLVAEKIQSVVTPKHRKGRQLTRSASNSEVSDAAIPLSGGPIVTAPIVGQMGRVSIGPRIEEQSTDAGRGLSSKGSSGLTGEITNSTNDLGRGAVCNNLLSTPNGTAIGKMRSPTNTKGSLGNPPRNEPTCVLNQTLSKGTVVSSASTMHSQLQEPGVPQQGGQVGAVPQQQQLVRGPQQQLHGQPQQQQGTLLPQNGLQRNGQMFTNPGFPGFMSGSVLTNGRSWSPPPGLFRPPQRTNNNSSKSDCDTAQNLTPNSTSGRLMIPNQNQMTRGENDAPPARHSANAGLQQPGDILSQHTTDQAEAEDSQQPGQQQPLLLRGSFNPQSPLTIGINANAQARSQSPTHGLQIGVFKAPAIMRKIFPAPVPLLGKNGQTRGQDQAANQVPRSGFLAGWKNPGVPQNRSDNETATKAQACNEDTEVEEDSHVLPTNASPGILPTNCSYFPRSRSQNLFINVPSSGFPSRSSTPSNLFARKQLFQTPERSSGLFSWQMANSEQSVGMQRGGLFNFHQQLFNGQGEQRQSFGGNAQQQHRPFDGNDQRRHHPFGGNDQQHQPFDGNDQHDRNYPGEHHGRDSLAHVASQVFGERNSGEEERGQTEKNENCRPNSKPRRKEPLCTSSSPKIPRRGTPIEDVAALKPQVINSIRSEPRKSPVAMFRSSPKNTNPFCRDGKGGRRNSNRRRRNGKHSTSPPESPILTALADVLEKERETRIAREIREAQVRQVRDEKRRDMEARRSMDESRRYETRVHDSRVHDSRVNESRQHDTSIITAPIMVACKMPQSSPPSTAKRYSFFTDSAVSPIAMTSGMLGETNELTGLFGDLDVDLRDSFLVNDRGEDDLLQDRATSKTKSDAPHFHVNRPHVFCRVRPRLPREERSKQCVFHPSHLQKTDSESTDGDGKNADPKLQSISIHDSNTREAREFRFHNVFGPGASQDEVFDSIGLPVFQSWAFKNVSTCLFAHGQTSTGKTYSILGDATVERSETQSQSGVRDTLVNPVDAGLLPRILHRFFTVFPDAALRVSIVEIYREQLHDLLKKRNVVKCYNSSIQTIRRSVAKIECNSCASALRVLEIGSRMRVEAHTALNKNSSRGHMVILLERIVKSVNEAGHPVDHYGNDEDGEETLPGPTLCVVDLAGKETEAGIDSLQAYLFEEQKRARKRSVSRGRRHGRADAEQVRVASPTLGRPSLGESVMMRLNLMDDGGERRARSLGGTACRRSHLMDKTPSKHSCNSEKGICYLPRKDGTCQDPVRVIELRFINKSLYHLSEVIQGLRRSKRVCFRNSKLTFLLQDWLASKQIFLLATVSPSDLCFDESLSTMRFADCVASLPHRKVVISPVVNFVKKHQAYTYNYNYRLVGKSGGKGFNRKGRGKGSYRGGDYSDLSGRYRGGDYSCRSAGHRNYGSDYKGRTPDRRSLGRQSRGRNSLGRNASGVMQPLQHATYQGHASDGYDESEVVGLSKFLSPIPIAPRLTNYAVVSSDDEAGIDSENNELEESQLQRCHLDYSDNKEYKADAEETKAHSEENVEVSQRDKVCQHDKSTDEPRYSSRCDDAIRVQKYLGAESIFHKESLIHKEDGNQCVNHEPDLEAKDRSSSSSSTTSDCHIHVRRMKMVARYGKHCLLLPS